MILNILDFHFLPYQKNEKQNWVQRKQCCYLGSLATEDSRPSGSFFTQVDHLFLANSFSKQVINPADFVTLKISDPSDHWFKSYGQKVDI